MTKRKLKLFFLVVIPTAFFQQCEPEPERRVLLYSSSISPVDATSVTVNTSVLDAPVDQADAYGYCWSTASNPTIEDDTSRHGGFPQAGEFSGMADGLRTGVEYHLRAYLLDKNGVAHYGNELVFQNDFFSQFERTRLNAITEQYFEVSSVIQFNGNPEDEHGHVWATTAAPTIDNESGAAVLNNIGDNKFTFHSRLSGLQALQTYYIRPFTKNQWGVRYGNQITITVPSEIVSGNWSEKSVPEAGLFHYRILQDENDLYFITGIDGNNFGEYRAGCYRVNLANGTSEMLPPYPGQSNARGQGFVLNGKVFYVCDERLAFEEEEENTCTDLWEYNPATNEWSLRMSADQYYHTNPKFSGVFEGQGYVGSESDDGNVYISMFQEESDLWFLAGVFPLDGDFLRRATTVAPGGQFIYFVVSKDIIEFDVYSGEYRRIEFASVFSEDNGFSYPSAMFFYKGSLYVITNLLEVYVLEGETGKWHRRNSIPTHNDPQAIFAGTYEGKPLVAVYTTDDYLSLIKEDYSLWYQYSE